MAINFLASKPTKSNIITYLIENSNSNGWVFGLLVLVLIGLSRISNASSSDVDAPFGISYLKYTPRWASNFIYAVNAIDVIQQGYLRVRNILYEKLDGLIICPVQTFGLQVDS